MTFIWLPLDPVPQGTILGLLFLVYVNDLPTPISYSISMFADDCVVYNVITRDTGFSALQSDINTISSWCNLWLMQLNINKCKFMRVPHTCMCPKYQIDNLSLQSIHTINVLQNAQPLLEHSY